MNTTIEKLFNLTLPEDIEKLILDYEEHMCRGLELLNSQIRLHNIAIQSFYMERLEKEELLELVIDNYGTTPLDALFVDTLMTRIAQISLEMDNAESHIRECLTWLDPSSPYNNILISEPYNNPETKLEEQFNKTRASAVKLWQKTDRSLVDRIFRTRIDSIQRLKWLEELYEILIIANARAFVHNDIKNRVMAP